MTTESERLRALVFEMLAALAYLRSIDRLPDDVAFDRIEREARAALEITPQRPEPEPEKLKEFIEPPPLQSAVPHVEVFAPTIPGLSAQRECPKCGDVGPKIAHLKRRPRAGLQCQACGHEYPFPSAWV